MTFEGLEQHVFEDDRRSVRVNVPRDHRTSDIVPVWLTLDEDDYLKQPGRPSDRDFDVTVPEDRLWVMGDNRANSEDSRFHMQEAGNGSVPVDAVVGKVWAVVWPLSRFSTLETPTTFGNPALLTSGEERNLDALPAQTAPKPAVALPVASDGAGSCGSHDHDHDHHHHHAEPTTKRPSAVSLASTRRR